MIFPASLEETFRTPDVRVTLLRVRVKIELVKHGEYLRGKRLTLGAREAAVRGYECFGCKPDLIAASGAHRNRQRANRRLVQSLHHHQQVLQLTVRPLRDLPFPLDRRSLVLVAVVSTSPLKLFGAFEYR